MTLFLMFNCPSLSQPNVSNGEPAIYLFLCLVSLLLTFNFLQLFCCSSIHQGTCQEIRTKTQQGRVHYFSYYFRPTILWYVSMFVGSLQGRNQQGEGESSITLFNYKLFYAGLFQCVFNEMLMEVSLFQKWFPCPEKFLVACLSIASFFIFIYIFQFPFLTEGVFPEVVRKKT